MGNRNTKVVKKPDKAAEKARIERENKLFHRLVVGVFSLIVILCIVVLATLPKDTETSEDATITEDMVINADGTIAGEDEMVYNEDGTHVHADGTVHEADHTEVDETEEESAGDITLELIEPEEGSEEPETEE